MSAPTDDPNSPTLDRILEVSRELGASSDLRQILSVIIDAMRDLLDAERATVFEFDPEKNQLFTSVAHGLDPSGGDGPVEIRIPADAGLAGESARTRVIINVPDAHADPRFNRNVDDKTGFRTRSLLTIPLVGYDGDLIGVAQVLNKLEEKSGGLFTDQDVEIARALAAHAAVAIKRGRLIEDRVVREKLERDLELARQIQREFLPEVLPALAGFEFAAWTAPADQTGGDMYDLIGIPEGEPASERVLLFVGDATGHGVGPALSVTQARSMLRMAVRLNVELEQIGRHLNDQICADTTRGRFITSWLGQLDSNGSELVSISAGQAPLLLYLAAEDRVVRYQADGPPYGIAPALPVVAARRIPMSPGDVFAVISDGIFDAMNRRGEPFGTERTEATLHASARRPAEETLSALRAALDRHCGRRPADDDRTVLVIRRRPVS